MPDYVSNRQWTKRTDGSKPKFSEKLREYHYKLTAAAWKSMQDDNPGKMNTLWDAYKLFQDKEAAGDDTVYNALKSAGTIERSERTAAQLGASQEVESKPVLIHGVKTARQSSKDTKRPGHIGG